ncbi:DUF1614 domain-containing protein [Halonatronum saccharophilum]|uniref:DUF1614 domain-containing protein n=1 Tax=Halonatronum saccharophilum TaxID=150060 RepID=UPI000486479B|nr:DUF1614 domain-containing protein [Halonatronum saccharophilum]
MPMGVVVLVVLQILIYFGFAERVIERMGISNRGILIFFALMIVGSFIDIPISSEPVININLGGAIVPIALAIYILSKADEKKEVVRTVIATVLAGGAIFALTQFYQFEEGHTLIDTNYLFPIVIGVIAYAVGRSRRGAFVAGVLGFLIYDLIHLFRITLGGIPGEAEIGGAGAFDSIVMSGLIAVLLAEIVGELRENIGGTKKKKEGYFRGDKLAPGNVEFGELGSRKDRKKDDRGEVDERSEGDE